MKTGKLVITLKEALKLSKEELENFKKELKAKIEARPELNAYIDVNNIGEGVPIAIKDNIQVKDWSVTSGSNILQGYIAPYNATVPTHQILLNGGVIIVEGLDLSDVSQGRYTLHCLPLKLAGKKC